ncbi:MAG: endonuclease III [Candidatus Nitronauta litoralis]|uniref:Endonuclease III n=1 Tax=Candidatus Nitronauta litoralis TaxID=2705533 RepID=A0A7T0G131_9BACT|nr:MAG: endonuclease III [Candidatus Nitronauta litoralis]
MDSNSLPITLKRLRAAAKKWRIPSVTQIAREGDPFRVLVSTLLSLRTRDEVMEEAAERVFALANNPRSMLRIPPEKLQKAIYPVAFFRNKRRSLSALCQKLVAEYGGEVPDTLEELLALPGVGRKTANLTLILGFDKPGICVDTHVHRIVNRWDYVRTRNPDETEMALRESLPKRYWKEFNELLVAFGQNCCKPTSPICSECPVEEFCRNRGVKKKR